MTDNTGAMNDLIAAVDLGSNSFHMVIAQEFQGEIRTLERRGQKVQLAAGLDERGILSEEAQQRGLECLREFAQFMQGMEPRRVSVLATNALRAARNRQQFIERAEEILGYPIEVIAGRRLVVDIGGGSTEFIIGERFEPKALESLHMGCVSYTKQFFPDGVITEARFDDAVDAARQELLNIETHYKQLGWHSAVGSSGTIRAAEQALVENGWEAEGITPAGLKKLRKQMLQYATTDDVSLPGVKPERRQVFIGGLAILQAVFDTFGLERMIYSDGALREGALWDLVGRSTHENVRERTVQAMAERFYVDTAQAQRVKEMARALFAQVQKDWKLDNGWGYWLDWASQLHEIGLSIAHSGFHKHGAYLVQHADLLGFTRQGQAKLAAMVRSHRRKFLPECFFRNRSGQPHGDDSDHALTASGGGAQSQSWRASGSLSAVAQRGRSSATGIAGRLAGRASADRPRSGGGSQSAERCRFQPRNRLKLASPVRLIHHRGQCLLATGLRCMS